MTLLARDVMGKGLKTVDPEMTLVDLERFLISERIGGAPVLEDGKLVGIISHSDIIRRLCLEQSMAEVQSEAFKHYDEGQRTRALSTVGDQVGTRMQELRVKDAMTPIRAQATPDTPLQQIAELMAAEGVHRVPIVDRGRPIGIVARIDLVRQIAAGKLREA